MTSNEQQRAAAPKRAAAVCARAALALLVAAFAAVTASAEVLPEDWILDDARPAGAIAKPAPAAAPRASARQSASGELRRRAFLGAQLGPVAEEDRARLKLGSRPGVLVVRVVDNSSAADAKLAAGDAIVGVAGKAPAAPGELVALMRSYYAGDRVPFEIVRDGRAMTIDVTLKARPAESHPGVEVVYDVVATKNGRRRTILTRPAGEGRHPAVLLVGGIGCYSLDGVRPDDAYGRILYGLTERGYVTMRVEKTGMGDSEGPACTSPEADLYNEVAGYVAGLRALKARADVDPSRVFIVGHSIGGIVGPLVAAEEPVRGLVVAETVGANWYEYLLENYRRQLVLASVPYDEVDRLLKVDRDCQERLIFGKQPPDEIVQAVPECAGRLEYPAPYTYMRQLGELNLASVWKKVDAQVLVIYGTSDFVTSAEEHTYLRDTINSFHPGSARYVEIAGMTHGFEHAASQKESFTRRGEPAEPVPQLYDEITKWLGELASAPVASRS